MRELMVVASKEYTVALYLNNKMLKAVYGFNELINPGIATKLPEADKTVILADDTLLFPFVYDKTKTKKGDIFRDISSRDNLNTTDIVYAVEEFSNFFVVTATDRITYSKFTPFKPNSVTSLEFNIGINYFNKNKRPLILKGKTRYYEFADDLIKVVNTPDKLMAYGDALIMSTSLTTYDADVADIRNYIKGTVVRPWLTARVSVDKSVNNPEWVFVYEFNNPEFLNLSKETFTVEQERALPPEVKNLVKAGVIFLSSIVITAGAQFIPFNLPFERIAPPPIPQDISIVTTVELQKFVYNAGNSYTLYRIVSDGQDKGYFINRDEALKFAQAIQGIEVYEVKYENGNEVSRTRIY